MRKFAYALLLIFISSTSFSQIPSATNTGSLNVPRWLHESQLLYNGKVLAFGGDNGNYLALVNHKSAELYNPSTGTWSYTGSMQIARTDFTSALLPNGNVIAIGGSDESGNYQASCEIYNVTAGTWSMASPMSTERTDHEAVVLQNGKVLVVGGSGDNSCEIYDPSDNTWSYTSGNVHARGKGVSLVLLQDGKVLATGGDASLARKSAEIYDPSTGTWTLVANPMSRERYFHSSILMNDGNVLIVGTGSADFGTQIFAEVYYIHWGSFSLTSTMQSNVGKSDMVLTDNGNALLYGIGDIFSPGNTKIIQMYDGGSWTTGSYSTVGTNVYTIHRLQNGKILIVGGSFTTGNGASENCVLLSQNNFSSCAPPSLSLTAQGQIACPGKDASVLINGTEAGVSYQPMLANGIAAGDAIQGGGDISLNVSTLRLAQGNNILKVKVSKPGCVAYYLTDTAVVHVTPSSIPAPVITPSGSLSFCPGGSVQLSAPAGFEGYVWSNGATSQSISINKYGYFSVRVKDASGCASAPSQVVQTQIYPTTISAGSSESVCISKAPYLLTGFSPIGGTWTGTGVSSNGTFDPATAGIGTFTLTYKLCGRTSTKTITVASETTVQDFTIVSNKDSLCINSSATITVFNTDPSTIYNLSKNGVQVGNASYGNGSSLSFSTGNLTATTIFSVRGTKGSTCGTVEVIKNKTIVVVPNPDVKVLRFSQDTVCAGKTVTFKIAQSDPWIKYRYYDTYYFGNGDTLSFQSPVLNSSGIYKILAVNSLNCGSAVEVASRPLVVHKHIVSFNAEEAYPQSSSVQLTNTSNGDTYQWTFDNTASQLTSQALHPSLHYNSIGGKTIKLLSQSRFGCTDSVKKYVNIYTAGASSTGSSCFLDSLISPVPPPGDYLTSTIAAQHVDHQNNTYIVRLVHLSVGAYWNGAYSYYLQKLDPAGKVLWSKTKVYGIENHLYDYVSAFINGVTTDLDGNVYIAGSYTNKSFKFDHLSTPLYSNIVSNTFIIKMNAAGVAQWMIYGDDTGVREVGATDILYADNDHIYVSMHRGNKMVFHDGTFNNFDENPITVMQINKDGKFKRSFAAQGNPLCVYNQDPSAYVGGRVMMVAPKMKLSSSGKLFLGGKFTNTITFGASTITRQVNYRGGGYIAVLDTVSGWQSAFFTHDNQSAESYSTNIRLNQKYTVDASDNVYVTDSYSHFEGITNAYYYKPRPEYKITLPDNTVLGDTSGSFIGKYDINGNLLWYNHSPYTLPVAIEYVPSVDQVITYGMYHQNSILLRSQSGTLTGIPSAGKVDAYLSAINSSGNVTWIEKIGGSGNDFAAHMTINSCNELSLVGRMDKKGGLGSDSLYYPAGKLFLARYSPAGNCVSSCNSMNTAPKASIYTSFENRTNISPVPVYIKFNESVSGFDQSDLVVTNASISGFTGSGSSYQAFLVPIAEGLAMTAKVSEAAATDGVFNSSASNKVTITWDTIAPAIAISSASNYFNTATLSVSLTPSEYLKNFTASDILLTNCNLQSLTSNGKNYTLTVKPFSEGELSISVPYAVATDTAGNPNKATLVFKAYYDITRPYYTITTTSSKPTAVTPIPVTIKFSEPIQPQTFTQVYFNSSGASFSSIENPSGDKMTFTGNIHCTATTNSVAYLSDVAIKDLANNTVIIFENGVRKSHNLDFYYDITKPAIINFGSTTSTITSVSPIPVTLHFNESVFGLSPSDFVVTNGSVSQVTGIGSKYEVQVTPSADGLVSLQLAADMVADTVGNTNAASPVFTRTYDGLKPSVTITSPSAYTNVSLIPITITFSENVTDFTAADIVVLAGGTVSSFAGSGKVYTAKVAAVGGRIVVKINDGAALDAGKNGNTESNTLIVYFDGTKPTLTITSSAGHPTRDSVIVITFTFSEDVYDFTMEELHGGHWTRKNFTGSGSVYTVEIRPTSLGYTHVVVETGAVRDAAGNVNDMVNFYFTYQGQDYTRPTVQISSAESGVTSSSPIALTITFSEEANLFYSASQLEITNGSMYYENGWKLYPASPGLVTVRMKENIVFDVASNGNLESNLYSIIYDNGKPFATITSTSADPAYDHVIPVSITFNEIITGLSVSDFTLVNATLSNLQGNGTTYTAELKALSKGTVSMTLKANTVTDQAGNSNNSMLFSILYDGDDLAKPTLSISSSAGTATNQNSMLLTFTFSEPITGFSADDIVLVNGVLTGFTGSGTTYTATVTAVSEGSIGVSVPSDVSFDNQSNGNLSSMLEVTYDVTKPTASISTTVSDPANATSIPVIIEFTEAINGQLTLSDFSLVNGTLSDLQKSGNQYTALLTPASKGLVSLSLNEEVVTDNSGNGNTGSVFSFNSNIVTKVQSTWIKEIKITPNPSQGIVHLQGIQELDGAEIIITSIHGLELFKTVVRKGQLDFLDISNLPNGSYYLRISHEGMLHNELLIMQQ